MKSKCAVLEGINKIVVKEVEVPKLTEGLLIKVYACGVCGTDPHIIKGEFKATQFPSVLGHELYGEIVEISNNCDVECINGDYAVGDIVALVPGVSCGECVYCKELPDDEQICPHRTTYGLNLPMSQFPVLGGGYTEYSVIKNGFKVYKVDKSWEFGYGVLLEPVAVTVKAVEKGLALARKTKNRDLSVCVQGCGTIGLFVAITLKKQGIEPIIIDVKENRIATAKKLGFKNAHLINNDNYVSEVKEILGEYKDLGFDAVFECAGSLESFGQAKEIVRRGGVIIEMGNFANSGDTNINPSEICRFEHVIAGTVLATAKYYTEAEKILDEVKEYYSDIICPMFEIEQVEQAIKNVEVDKLGLKSIIVCNKEK